MFVRGSTISMLLGVLLIVPMVLLLAMKGLNRNWDNGKPYRTWTDQTGQFSARARLKADHGNSVVLERQDDGKFVTIPLDRLSARDRRFLLYGEEESENAIDLEKKAVELFPFSFGQWEYSSSVDLWAALVNRTPVWVTLSIPLGVGTLGYLLFLRSRSRQS